MISTELVNGILSKVQRISYRTVKDGRMVLVKSTRLLDKNHQVKEILKQEEIFLHKIVK